MAKNSTLKKHLARVTAAVTKQVEDERGAGTCEPVLWLQAANMNATPGMQRITAAANEIADEVAEYATRINLIGLASGRYIRWFPTEEEQAKERGEEYTYPDPLPPVYVQSGRVTVNEHGIAVAELERAPARVYTETADEAMARINPEYAAEVTLSDVNDPDNVRVVVKADQVTKIRPDQSDVIDVTANHAQRDAALADDDWTEYEDGDAPARPVAVKQSRNPFPTKQPEVEIVEVDGAGPKPIEVDTAAFLQQLEAERAKLSGTSASAKAPDLPEPPGIEPDAKTGPVVLGAPAPFGANQP
ncbi:MAG: hypothetical protein KKG78_06050 [Alphaproteobacteria bacterium]|nr:hypothetical protein [Alphaproteobacteria bacterium]